MNDEQSAAAIFNEIGLELLPSKAYYVLQTLGSLGEVFPEGFVVFFSGGGALKFDPANSEIRWMDAQLLEQMAAEEEERERGPND